ILHQLPNICRPGQAATHQSVIPTKLEGWRTPPPRRVEGLCVFRTLNGTQYQEIHERRLISLLEFSEKPEASKFQRKCRRLPKTESWFDAGALSCAACRLRVP